MLNSILVIFCLIAIGALFSMSEISLVTSYKIKPKLLTDESNMNAQRTLNTQENPGVLFTAVQTGLGAMATLGDIIGDTAFSPVFHSLFSRYASVEFSKQPNFILSFSLAAGVFILFADLTPKHVGMIAPGAVALRIINPMRFCLYVCTPLVWFFNGLVNIVLRIFRLPMVRKDDITSDDIYAVVKAGVLAGVLHKQEHELIEDVLELEFRTVPPSVTPRENMIRFDLHESEQSLKDRVVEHPYSKPPACSEDIDHIIGYVDSKDLLNRVLASQSLALNSDAQIRSTLIVLDTLTLSETSESFEIAGEDFTVVMDEYTLVMGIITPSNMMVTLMGGLVGQGLEEQVVAHDESSWLIDDGTPIDGVMRALDIDEFPQSGNYEATSDFVMFMLYKIPKCTDSVKFVDYRFKVVNIDSHCIDQLLVTRIDSKVATLSPKLSDAKDREESVA